MQSSWRLCSQFLNEWESMHRESSFYGEIVDNTEDKEAEAAIKGSDDEEERGQRLFADDGESQVEEG